MTGGVGTCRGPAGWRRPGPGTGEPGGRRPHSPPSSPPCPPHTAGPPGGKKELFAFLTLPLSVLFVYTKADGAHLFVEGEAVDNGPVADDVVEEPAGAVVHSHPAVTVPGKGRL